jgi:hypothetical protein
VVDYYKRLTRYWMGYRGMVMREARTKLLAVGNDQGGLSNGTEGSNPSRSANESRLCGFSVRIGGIARACGFICVMRGTGENHFPAVRAQDAAKVSVGK